MPGSAGQAAGLAAATSPAPVRVVGAAAGAGIQIDRPAHLPIRQAMQAPEPLILTLGVSLDRAGRDPHDPEHPTERPLSCGSPGKGLAESFDECIELLIIHELLSLLV